MEKPDASLQPLVSPLSPRPLRAPNAMPCPPCTEFHPRPFAPNGDYPPPKHGEPPLFKAARIGDHVSLRKLLSEGIDVEQTFDIGLDPGARPRFATSLMVALGSGDGANTETVSILMDAGANPRAQTNCGTPVSFAACGLGWGYKPGGDAGRLSLVLSRGGVLPTDEEDRAAMVAAAASEGDADSVRLLLDLGLSPDPWWDPEVAQRRHEEFLKWSRQFSACLRQEAFGTAENRVEQPASEIGAEQNAESPEEPHQHVIGPRSVDIPLFQAASSGSVETVTLLIERGANPNQIDDAGQTALFHAPTPNIAAALIKLGANPAHLDTEGTDPVIGVFRHQNREDDWPPLPSLIATARVIADAVPSYDPITFEPWPHSKLARAAFDVLEGAVEVLLSKGAPVVPPPETPSALHQVCWNGSSTDDCYNTRGIRIVELLAAAGADPNGIDAWGHTPLSQAAGGDGAHGPIARALLELGANPNAPDPSGSTPLILAARSGELECVEALIQHGADPLPVDKEGRSALDHARETLAWRSKLAAETRSDDSFFRIGGIDRKTYFKQGAADAARALATIEAHARRSMPPSRDNTREQRP